MKVYKKLIDEAKSLIETENCKNVKEWMLDDGISYSKQEELDVINALNYICGNEFEDVSSLVGIFIQGVKYGRKTKLNKVRVKRKK